MKNPAKKFALTAFIGATAGYVAGILTAPKSGKQTRKDIADAAIKTKTEAEKRLKDLHSQLDKLMIQAKTGAKKLHTSAKTDFAAAITKAQFAKDKAREMLSALHDGDAKDKDLQKAVTEAKQAVDHLKTYLSKNGKSQKNSTNK